MSSATPTRPAPARRTSSIALAISACQAGHRVRSRPPQQWVARLDDAQHRNALETSCRRIVRYALIVVDEVGYLPFDRQAANLMFALVSRRYERASMIVTSNRGFEAWGEIFGDDMVAAAMIDRLIHHAEMLTLKGESYRLRERAAGAAQAVQPPGLRPSA